MGRTYRWQFGRSVTERLRWASFEFGWCSSCGRLGLDRPAAAGVQRTNGAGKNRVSWLTPWVLARYRSTNLRPESHMKSSRFSSLFFLLAVACGAPSTVATRPAPTQPPAPAPSAPAVTPAGVRPPSHPRRGAAQLAAPRRRDRSRAGRELRARHERAARGQGAQEEGARRDHRQRDRHVARGPQGEPLGEPEGDAGQPRR